MLSITAKRIDMPTLLQYYGLGSSVGINYVHLFVLMLHKGKCD